MCNRTSSGSHETNLASLQATLFVAAALVASSLLSRAEEAYDFSRQRSKSKIPAR